MTLEEEEAIIAQLTPQERAEHQEMSEFYQIQAATTGQGMVPRSASIQGKAQQQAPGLPADLLQWIVKVEPDEEKRDIGRIIEVEQQAILQKKERIPQTTKPGIEKGYYVYIEDDDDTYLEIKDEHGETVLVLDMETNQQLVPNLITEKDMNKYFVQPDEQEHFDSRL